MSYYLRTPTRTPKTTVGRHETVRQSKHSARFSMPNLLEVLEESDDCCSDGSGCSATSPGESSGCSIVVAMSPRSYEDVFTQPATQKSNVYHTPSQNRRKTIGVNHTPSTFGSPAQGRMRSATIQSLGPPFGSVTPSGLDNGRLPGTPHTPYGFQRRASAASQMSPTPHRQAGRPFPSFQPQVSIMMQEVPPMSMHGIPELLAVQEMAYRQGQQDHGVSIIRIPPSPFAERFDQVWIVYYKLGKTVGGKPNSTKTSPSSTPGQQNFEWSVLVNPYTQDLKHPNGTLDVEWVRKICEISLKCMEELISIVCQRGKDWQKIICDVPSHVKKALEAFDDLRALYEQLHKDASEALGGGLPMGYAPLEAWY